MLLRFGVQNFRSIRTMQELSLVASALDDTRSGLIRCPAIDGSLLPAVVVYGANASGKSNLVRALSWMRQAIMFSHSRGEPGRGVPRDPFKLDPASRTAATLCSVDFIVENVRYHYGFEASDEIFLRESLYSFPVGRRQVLFEREAQGFEFGRHLRGRNKTIAELTRPNSLFLSAAMQNDHEQLTQIGEFFRAIWIEEPTRWSRIGDIDPKIVEFLDAAGTGVVGARVKNVELDDKTREFGRDLNALFRKAFGEDSAFQMENEVEARSIQLAHRGRDGTETYFELDDESAGTRRLLDLLVPGFRALDTGALMVVDELDDSLHTQACEALLALFSSARTNPKGAQLIATTHDTNLLRSPLLRRDQVWFTEKASDGATHVYPLTDFRTRKGDNLARGYLQGRYGAIPLAGSPSDLIASE